MMKNTIGTTRSDNRDNEERDRKDEERDRDGEERDRDDKEQRRRRRRKADSDGEERGQPGTWIQECLPQAYILDQVSNPDRVTEDCGMRDEWNAERGQAERGQAERGMRTSGTWNADKRNPDNAECGTWNADKRNACSTNYDKIPHSVSASERGRSARRKTIVKKECDRYSTGYFKCPRSVSIFTEYALQLPEIGSSQTGDWRPSWINK